MRLRPVHVMLLTVGVLGSLEQPAHAQTYRYWKNQGTGDWDTAGNWSPGGIPLSTDDVVFNAQGGAAGSTAGFNPYASAQQPTITGSQSARSLTLAPSTGSGNWTFSGGGTLTLGGTSSTGLTTSDPGTYTFDSVTLQGLSSSDTLAINVTGASTLVLTGSTTAITNISPQINLAGGTLVLDNSSNNSSSRLSTSTGLFFQSGTLELRGNTAATTNFSLGALVNTNTAGFNTIRLVPASGQQLTVNFANSGGVNTRLSSFSAFRISATSGVLGGPGATDPKVTFSGTPNLGANGLLASSAGGPSFGYFTVSDAGEIDFATWSLGTGVTAAGVSNANLNTGSIATIRANSTDNTTRAFYTPGTGTDTAGGAVTVGSLRITPTAAGATLAMGSNSLVTNALMLGGGFDYTISGSGLLGGGGTRYVYVNDANTVLTTGLVVVNGTNQTSGIGPGFLVFNGAAIQDTGNTTANSSNRFDLMGGITVRGTDANFGFRVTVSNPTSGGGNDAYAAINLRGGVIEIQGGSNGTGTSADFTRPLGIVDGTVRWAGGNGGFSAFGSAASVNIGGNLTPTTLQWGAANFVADGYALTFGSLKSNAVLTFLNPIQLDNGNGYQLREIRVIGGVGGDRTVITGQILTSSTAADLLKTGTGTLELANPSGNGFAGNLFVNAGTLLISNTSGNGVGSGVVTVAAGATFGGSGITGGVSNNNGSVFMLPGGSIQAGSGTVVNTALRVGLPGQTANLTLGNNSTVRILVAHAGGPTDTSNAAASRVAVSGQLGRNSTSDQITLLLTNDGADPLATDGITSNRRTLLTYGSLGNLNTGTYTAGDGVFSLSGSNFTVGSGWQVNVGGGSVEAVFTVAPVPEPATVLGIATVGLGLVAVARRRRCQSS